MRLYGLPCPAIPGPRLASRITRADVPGPRLAFRVARRTDVQTHCMRLLFEIRNMIEGFEPARHQSPLPTPPSLILFLFIFMEQGENFVPEVWRLLHGVE